MIQKDIGRHLVETYSHVGCEHQNKETNTRVAVLVETRDAYFLPLVLKNFCIVLGGEWNFHLFINDKVENFLTTELPDFQYRKTTIRDKRMTPKQYSYLLRQRQFWEQIYEETILIFQIDCLLLRPIPTWVEQYDMIGAPCGLIRGNEMCVYNGGFSLRKKKAMQEVALENVRQNQLENRPEDVFFTDLLWEKSGYNLPDVQTSYQFATEDVYSTHPVGIHGTDKYYS